MIINLVTGLAHWVILLQSCICYKTAELSRIFISTKLYVKSLIETGPYQLLNKDPTDRLSCKLTEKLLSLKRNGHLSETAYNKIRPIVDTNSHLGSMVYLRYTSLTYH